MWSDFQFHVMFLSKKKKHFLEVKMNRVNKTIIFIVSLIILTFSFALPAESVNTSVIDKIKILPEDIPEGFRYGLIPDFAKSVLLNNPWSMNKAAINKLAKSIYPGGDPSAIKNMHMSIIAKNDKPYNDDIVCYIIEYKDAVSGLKEMTKLTEFSRFNQDRTIVVQKGTVAIFFLVDDIQNYRHIQRLKNILEQRLPE
jgi:hypothetical protein